MGTAEDKIWDRIKLGSKPSKKGKPSKKEIARRKSVHRKRMGL